MSHRAISGQQFHHQLPMFMEPSKIIDTLHKGDSELWGTRATPREQWEGAGSARPDWTRPIGSVGSLRDEKLNEMLDNPKATHKGISPLAIMHTVEGPALWDGHHRLAYAEHHKIPWVPVKHQER